MAAEASWLAALLYRGPLPPARLLGHGAGRELRQSLHRGRAARLAERIQAFRRSGVQAFRTTRPIALRVIRSYPRSGAITMASSAAAGAATAAALLLKVTALPPLAAALGVTVCCGPAEREGWQEARRRALFLLRTARATRAGGPRHGAFRGRRGLSGHPTRLCRRLRRDADGRIRRRGGGLALFLAPLLAAGRCWQLAAYWPSRAPPGFSWGPGWPPRSPPSPCSASTSATTGPRSCCRWPPWPARACRRTITAVIHGLNTETRRHGEAEWKGS